MTVYVRFENKQQVETITADKKPPDTGWHKAPEDFEWGKRYQLENGKMQLMADVTIMEMELETKRNMAMGDVRICVDMYRKKYMGYSAEKSQGYAVQSREAELVLAGNTGNTLQLLASTRGISVEKMAALIQQKTQRTAKAMVICEALEDGAIMELKKANTPEAVKVIVDTLASKLTQSLAEV